MYQVHMLVYYQSLRGSVVGKEHSTHAGPSGKRKLSYWYDIFSFIEAIEVDFRSITMWWVLNWLRGV